VEKREERREENSPAATANMAATPKRRNIIVKVVWLRDVQTAAG
jgi:hypothetical protein